MFLGVFLLIIAVDGPAGTGKGTICKMLADKYNFLYIDTGAMYRAVTLRMLRNNVGTNDIEKIRQILDNIDIDLVNENGGQKVFLDGEDVSKLIRMPDVNACVSAVSAVRIIREKLVEIQRGFGKSKNVIMEGRDITTVVFPDADVKIYLTATLEERANRRFKEFLEKGIDTSYETVLKEVEKRDLNDMNKEYGALRIADDAIVIDTTEKSIEDVLKEVEAIIFCKNH